MLVTYWRAALLAAAMVFSANAVRAEDQPGKGSDCCKGKECAQKCDQLNCKILILQGKKSEAGCCQTGSCCAATSKAGQCCKDEECSKDAECCKGECGACGGGCTAKTATAKTTTFSHPIIVFVPVPMMPPMNHVVMPQAIASQPYHIAPPAPMAAPPMPSQPVAMP